MASFAQQPVRRRVRAAGRTEDATTVAWWSEPAAEREPQRSTTQFVYRFTEGSDVIGLCRAYLDAVKALVADGRSRGSIPDP